MQWALHGRILKPQPWCVPSRWPQADLVDQEKSSRKHSDTDIKAATYTLSRFIYCLRYEVVLSFRQRSARWKCPRKQRSFWFPTVNWLYNKLCSAGWSWLVYLWIDNRHFFYLKISDLPTESEGKCWWESSQISDITKWHPLYWFERHVFYVHSGPAN